MTALATTARDQALADVFTTALEGGIGYWSLCSEYRWSDGDGNSIREFRAVVQDTQDGEDTEYVIDRSVIAKGIRLAYEHRGKGHTDYHARALADLQFGRYDVADFDADTADMIVQFGLGLLSKSGGPMYG